MTSGIIFFQVSVKGLFANRGGKFLMLQDPLGLWNFPGGRMQKGENFVESLKRERLEETGVECEVLQSWPSLIYPAIDKEGRGRIMVFFKISFPNLNFEKTDECVKVDFFSKTEIEKLPAYPQLKQFSSLFSE